MVLIENSLFVLCFFYNSLASFSNGEIPVSASKVNAPLTTSSKSETTTSEQLPCPDGFTTVAEGWCFLVVHETKTWDNAEAHCQTFGQHVHLAGFETHEVSISLLKNYRFFSFALFPTCVVKLMKMKPKNVMMPIT